MVRAALPSKTVIAACPSCGRDLPPITVILTLGKPERAEDGSLVLPVGAHVDTSRRAFRAAVRLAHPRCFGDRDDAPIQAAA